MEVMLSKTAGELREKLAPVNQIAQSTDTVEN